MRDRFFDEKKKEEREASDYEYPSQEMEMELVFIDKPLLKKMLRLYIDRCNAIHSLAYLQ